MKTKPVCESVCMCMCLCECVCVCICRGKGGEVGGGDAWGDEFVCV